MVYDLKYGTLKDLLINNEFNCHETSCNRAIIELCGTFNEKISENSKQRTIVSVLLDYADRKPNKLSETTLEGLERACLVMYNKYDGGFYYVSEDNLLENGEIPYRADWVSNVKLKQLDRWQHFKYNFTEFVLQDYTDVKGDKLKCRNLRTMTEVMLPKDMIVEQLPLN